MPIDSVILKRLEGLADSLAEFRDALESSTQLSATDKRILLGITNEALRSFLREQQIHANSADPHATREERLEILLGLLQIGAADKTDLEELRIAVEEAYEKPEQFSQHLQGPLQNFFLVERLLDELPYTTFENGRFVP